MMKKDNVIRWTKVLLLSALLGLNYSCEDDSLPTEGSIEDVNLPIAGIAVSASETSFKTFVLTSSSRSATDYTWTIPSDASFAVNDTGVMTTEKDKEVFVTFSDEGTHQVSLEVTDDNDANNIIINSDNEEEDIAVLTLDIDVVVKDGVLDPSPVLTINNTLEFFELELSSEGTIDNEGGVRWDLPGGTLKEGYLETDEIVLVEYPGVPGSSYDINLVGINFNGVEVVETQTYQFGDVPDPVPSFEFTSSEDYLTKTITNTTSNTASVEWELPAGATLASGSSLTDEVIEVAFASAGDYAINLTVANILYDANVNDPETIERGTITIPVVDVNSLELPTIISPSFEGGIRENTGAQDDDLAKEDWRADGTSERSTKIQQAGTDPGLLNESWFSDPIDGTPYNRIQITSTAFDGQRAGKLQNSDRVAVQIIDVKPGVDYELSFYYLNKSGGEDVGIRAAILKEETANEEEAQDDDFIIAENIIMGGPASFVQHKLKFSSNFKDRVKIYFNQVENAGEVYFDLVEIAID